MLSPAIIAVSEKGSVFTSSGENEGWLKLKLGEELTGWVSKDDVVFADSQVLPGDSGFTEVFQKSPTINLVNPPLHTDSGQINLSGTIKDENGIQLVSIFVGDDKVELLPSKGKDVPISIPVKLADGINSVTVYAKNTRDVFSKRTFVVRKGA